MTKIKKRDNSIVEFSEAKIISAVSKAMVESGEYKESIAIEISDEVKAVVECSGKDFVEINDIQDLVEGLLVEHGLKKTSKNYILFRAERDRNRLSGDKSLQSKYFSPEFLKKYRYAKEPFEPLGGFVKARTYARWLPEEGRRETWYETVKRAVEFNLSLAKHDKKEAEELFHNVFYLKQNLSGRMTWLGGTKTAHSNALGLFNCAFDVVDSYSTFVEGFTVLMLGAGLGVRITKEDMVKMLPLRQNVDIVSKIYTPVLKKNRKEYSSLVEHSKNMIEIVIGDARGAWSTALDMYFKVMYEVQYKEVNTILMNYDNIREKGARIKGFGGKSSGFKTLMEMFENIHSVTQQGNGTHYKLKTIDALDIICLIALNVVSGNVRRSSIMVLCDEDDYDIINAKSDLYTQINGEWVINEKILHRQMSNNTIIYKDKPTRERYSDNFKKLRKSGEPATLNLKEALKRNPNAKGLNPLTD